MKTIGIIIRNFKENNKEFIGTRFDLFEMFNNYDVNIIAIPIFIDFKKIINLVNLCDGLILSGGDHFDDNDFLLVKYLYEKNIPTLGICLGMQSMGLTFGCKEEIYVDNHLSNNLYVHEIVIKENSLLFKILNTSKIIVNSRHKTAIKDTNLDVVARSNDNVIEGVEDSTKKFFLGLEWHPESIKDENSKKIFDYFLKNCQ